MKIALLLSGQPRFVEEVAPYILKNVCEGYDVDTFCHFWFDDDLQTKPYKFGECNKGEWHKQRIPSNALDKANEILNEVNKAKKVYEYANDFKYDWVVRCRTDSVIHTKIPFEQLDPSVINFSNLQGQPDGMINDWFDFAGSKEMDAFMSVFPVWQLILEKCLRENNGAYCHELMHRKMVDSFGIGIQGHPIQITLPRF